MPRAASASTTRLRECRRKIDRVDAVLASLLRERLRLAIDAGRIKMKAGEPLRAPARERAVLSRVRTLAGPPLEADRLERIFKKIITETLEAEKQRLARPNGHQTR